MRANTLLVRQKLDKYLEYWCVVRILGGSGELEDLLAMWGILHHAELHMAAPLRMPKGPSAVAFILVSAASLVVLMVPLLAGSSYVWTWFPLAPVVVAALPLAVRLRWMRAASAFLLTVLTFSALGAWVFYIPGVVASWFAVVKGDGQGPGGRLPRFRAGPPW